MMAHIPKNYDKSKAYPVIIALSTGNDGGFCWGPIDETIKESCICFDVTGRGFNGGSYIGEASTLEILEWIKKNYKIDEDRIYLLGQSNGGYATYSIAQNYPHLWAAIFPQLGNPYTKTIVNLINTPTYQMVSPKDHAFIGRENEVKNAINKYGNYHQYDFKEMIHHSLTHYIYHKEVLNNIFKSKRNLFPNKVIYITERNRHMESFWVKLQGIAKNRNIAKVKAEIISRELIKINVIGSHGITITIPPQMDRQNFAVKINNKIFNFHDYKEFKLIFCKNKVWCIAESELPIDYRKGTGLLDVYLNRMRVIIPNDFNPVMYTNYPIYLDTKIPNHIFSNNLILFDIYKSNSILKQLEDKLIFKYD